MDKKVAIIQSNYIPWKGYFDLINMVDELIIYDDVQFTKNDWRNRNKIITPHGVQWITIPVRHEKLHQTIKDTKTYCHFWNKKHWKTIQQNYSKTPYFKTYRDIFEQLYLTSTSDYLSEINVAFIQAINSILGITTKLTWSSEYDYGSGKTARLVRLVQLAGGTEYISGPSAKAYLDEPLFLAEGIKVSYMNLNGYPE